MTLNGSIIVNKDITINNFPEKDSPFCVNEIYNKIMYYGESGLEPELNIVQASKNICDSI